MVSMWIVLLKQTSNMATWRQIKTSNDDIGCRSSHGCSVWNEKLIVLGGEKVARTPVDSVIWTLSLSSDESTWTPLSTKTEAAPSPRVAHAQAISNNNNNMFVFGGRQGITMEESPLQDLWSFSFDSSTWTLIESNELSVPPTPRSFHRMISVGSNTLYVFGGCGAAGRLNDLYSYNIDTNIWKKLADAPADMPGRGGPGFVANEQGDSLFVVGGFCGSESNGVWKYDILNDTWSTVLEEGNKILRPFSVASGVTMGSTLVFFGGEVNPSEKGHEGAGGFTNDVIFLDGTTGLPTITTTISSVELPTERGWMDAAAVRMESDNSGQESKSIGNNTSWTLVVFGGLSGSDEQPIRLDDVWLLKM